MVCVVRDDDVRSCAVFLAGVLMMSISAPQSNSHETRRCLVMQVTILLA